MECHSNMKIQKVLFASSDEYVDFWEPISKIFYDKVIQNNIRFVSANALWSLVTYKHVTNKNIDIFKFLNYIFSDKESLGLLSGGVVKNTSQGLILERIDVNLL